MELKNTASAGTLESSDIMVTLEPAAQGVEIVLKSSVEKQFGRQIRTCILDTLQSLGVSSAKVTANDRGALDCTIKARVTAACYRASDSTEYKWGDD